MWILFNKKQVGVNSNLNYLIVKVDAAHSDDVHLIRRVVERAVEGTVVANGRDHDDSVCGQLPNLGTNSNKIKAMEISKLISSAHRTRSVRRLDFGIQRKLKHHMNPHGVGFQNIQKLKKSTEGPIFIVVHIVNSKFSAVEARNIFYDFL